MKKLAITLTIITLGALTHFAFAQKKLTPEIIQQNGTKEFNVSKVELLKIAQNVFIENGYKILIVNDDKGLVKTDRKYVKSIAQATGIGEAQQVDCYRQYIINVTASDSSKSKIVLTPKIYIGQTDVSDDKIWDLKGADGEIKLWESLFKNFEDYLK